MDLVASFYLIVVVPLALAIVTLLYNYKYIGKPLKLLLVLLLVYFAVDLSSAWIRIYARGTNTIWMGHFLTIIRFTIILYVFKEWLRPGLPRLITDVIIATFFIMWLVAKFTIEPIFGFYGYTGSASMVIITIYCLKIAVSPLENRVNLQFNSEYWILISILLYTIPALGVNAVQEYLVEDLDALKVIYVFKWVTMALSYIALGWAGICERVVALDTRRRER